MDLIVIEMEDTPSKDKEHTVLLGRPFMNLKGKVDHDNLRKDYKL